MTQQQQPSASEEVQARPAPAKVGHSRKKIRMTPEDHAMVRKARAERDARQRQERQARLGETLRASLEVCKSAYQAWGTSQKKADEKLFQALGAVYAATAPALADPGLFRDWLFETDAVRLDQRKSAYHYMLELMKVEAKKSSITKYAQAMLYAGLSAVDHNQEAFARFVQEQGGLSDCAEKYRRHQQARKGEDGRGRRSYRDMGLQALDRMEAGIPVNPDQLEGEGEAELFVMLARKGEDGRVALYPATITDQKVIDAALSGLGRQTQEEDD